VVGRGGSGLARWENEITAFPKCPYFIANFHCGKADDNIESTGVSGIYHIISRGGWEEVTTYVTKSGLPSLAMETVNHPPKSH